jgi:CHAT domain-containing protein
MGAYASVPAHALLASHWAVNSEATVSLIASAMHAIGGDVKAGRAEAMRQAMLRLIDQGGPRESEPAFWAPFAVVGEGAAPPAR